MRSGQVTLKGFDTRESFGWVTQLFHWVTFVLVAGLFAVGWYMVDLPNEPDKFQIYALHKSIGITVLTLAVLRVGWRGVNPTPPILGQPKRWERVAARVTHGLLYSLLLAVPVSGWVLSSAADFPASWFGIFELPNLVEPSDELRELTTTVHQTLGRILGILLLLHILAALKHHYVNKDATLVRMMPGRGAQPRT